MESIRVRNTDEFSSYGTPERLVGRADGLYSRSFHRIVEVGFDLLALSIAWRASILIRYALNPYFTAHLDRRQLDDLALPLAPILLVWTITQLRLNRGKDAKDISNASALRVAESALITAIVAVLVGFFSQGAGAPLARSYVLLFAVVSYGMIVVGRACASRVWKYVDKRWPVRRRVAVLGWGEEARGLARRMRSVSNLEIEVVGLIVPADCESSTEQHEIPVLGNTRQLAELVNAHGLTQLFTLDGSVPHTEVVTCNEVAKRMGVLVSRAIRPFDADSRVEVATLHGMHFVNLMPVKFTVRQQRAKYVFDMIVASALLVILSPILLCCALLIRISSQGPILFRSRRVGKGGRHFTFLKFRSMYSNRDGREIVADKNEKSGHIFKLRNDPRVTPIGSILRRYSLDELPQLINVIRGEMSLVGPRPLPASDLDPDGMSKAFNAWTRHRSSVLPGVTGLWQIRGRSDLSFEAMVDLDIEYIRQWSLLLDLKILLGTPVAVLSGRGAY